MTPLSIGCWKWTPRPDYRSAFGPDTVNRLLAMIRRHYAKPFTFWCCTDDATGLDQDVRVIPLPKDFGSLESPHGRKNPSCYRRLRMFAPDAAELFGPRFVSLDLDCVVTGDLAPVFDRSEDFVIYGDTNPRTHYNGSLLLMTAGARPQVWTQFDPAQSPTLAKGAGMWGSDQGWISYILGGGEARFSRRDGIYSYRNEVQPSGSLPGDARLIVFHGAIDPWSRPAQQLPWVRQHYGEVAA